MSEHLKLECLLIKPIAEPDKIFLGVTLNPAISLININGRAHTPNTVVHQIKLVRGYYRYRLLCMDDSKVAITECCCSYPNLHVLQSAGNLIKGIRTINNPSCLWTLENLFIWGWQIVWLYFPSPEVFKCRPSKSIVRLLHSCLSDLIV